VFFLFPREEIRLYLSSKSLLAQVRFLSWPVRTKQQLAAYGAERFNLSWGGKQTMHSSIGTLILVVAITGLFLVGRAFWWWYCGIDRIVEALESIDASLKQLPAVRQADRAGLRRS